MKNSRQIEKHIKGIANHYRIEILLMLDGGGMALEDIIEKTQGNEKTIGEHVRRLYLAGLVNKQHNGRFVMHSLSPYGKTFAKFLKSFKNN